MSLPLTRRIARAALLGAAGAASVVGAAGSASAVSVPATPDVGGLTQLDSSGLTNTVNQTAQGLSGQATNTGGKVVKKAAPAAGEAASKAKPTAREAARTVAKGVKTAGHTKSSLPADVLRTDGGGLPGAGQLTDQVGNVGSQLPTTHLTGGSALPIG